MPQPIHCDAVPRICDVESQPIRPSWSYLGSEFRVTVECQLAERLRFDANAKL